jgi:predicted dehydrogenase
MNTTRRDFITTTAAATLAGVLTGRAEDKPAAATPEFKRKIKLGVVGLGGRGTWLAGLFQKHGGYELHAVADYFPNVVATQGKALGVDAARQFSGLSGYKKVIESGAEAVVIIDVPYFYPEQAKAAVDAGLHVYMAKPVAVDVPGTLLVSETGKLATKKQRVLLVDYQLPTEPDMIELAKRIQAGGLGALSQVISFGFGWHAWPDPALEKTIESRLRGQIWLSDTALSGDTIVSYDIHIIDGIVFALGKRPVAAHGHSRTCRTEPHGDRTDFLSAVYELDGGALWTHLTQSLDNNWDVDVKTLSAKLLGTKATAYFQYGGGKIHLRGGDKNYVGAIGKGVYTDGAQRNIAAFYRNIVEGQFDNATVQRAVDGHLTAILGREAAARGRRLTMDELINENKKIQLDLTGLKA